MTTKKKITLIICSIFSLYFLSYLILRGNGQYVIIRSGELRPFALASSDKIIWNPDNSHYQTFKTVSGNYETKGNLKGYFYMPLIFLDRILFKPTYDFNEENAVKVKPTWSKY